MHSQTRSNNPAPLFAALVAANMDLEAAHARQQVAYTALQHAANAYQTDPRPVLGRDLRAAMQEHSAANAAYVSAQAAYQAAYTAYYGPASN